MVCVSDGFRTLIDLIAFSLSAMISVEKFGVGFRGIVGSGCCMSMKDLKWSAQGELKYEWSGPLCA